MTLKPTAMNKTCPRCAAEFECDGCTIGRCWCNDFPPILSCRGADGDEAQCLCPDCLKQFTQAHINQHIDTVAVHREAPAQASACAQLPLIEGLDYSIENGRWVFSRWYLLRKGQCCGNGCKNCPYGHVNVK